MFPFDLSPKIMYLNYFTFSWGLLLKWCFFYSPFSLCLLLKSLLNTFPRSFPNWYPFYLPFSLGLLLKWCPFYLFFPRSSLALNLVFLSLLLKMCSFYIPFRLSSSLINADLPFTFFSWSPPKMMSLPPQLRSSVTVRNTTWCRTEAVIRQWDVTLRRAGRLMTYVDPATRAVKIRRTRTWCTATAIKSGRKGNRYFVYLNDFNLGEIRINSINILFHTLVEKNKPYNNKNNNKKKRAICDARRKKN